ncbi:MAG: hypothetical protein MRZ79_25785 [Bacteroidia bacterium]|nr:hypothetical protein [Bacteroidia bacterium]
MKDNFSKLLLLVSFVFFIPTKNQAQKAIPFQKGTNTPYEEREPVISPDGKTMYFWRRKDPQNTGGAVDQGDIWFAQRGYNGNWYTAKPMGSPFNTFGQEFIWQISPQADTFWVVRNGGLAGGSGAGYMVKEGPNFWSKIYPIHIHGFKFVGVYKDFSFSKGRVMILTNQGSESYGGTDLYISFPLNDTAWTEPANLGPTINTSYDEDAPFLTPDGKTLYFNSNGHGGEGDHDIWVSYRLDDTWSNWTEPVNLGHPVNSDAYDFDFTLSPDGKWGYFASAREGGFGDHDLYRVNFSKCGLNIFPEGDHTVCSNEGIMLEAGFLPEQNISYQWYKNGKKLDGATERQLEVKEEGEYYLVRRSQFCKDSSEVQRINTVAPPLASILVPADTRCVDDSILLRAMAPDAISYEWIYNGLSIPYSDKAYLKIQRTGKYKVKVFNGSCYSTSEELEINTFDKPEIFRGKDTLLGKLGPLSRWLWTNKVPKSKKKVRLLDVTVDNKGQSFVLVANQKLGREQLSIKQFSREGLFKSKFESVVIPGKTHGYLAASPDGTLILADEDRFLVKFRKDGDVLWSKERSMPDMRGMALDPIGNIYVCAEYSDTLRFGRKNFAPIGRGGIFLAKFSSRGEMLWVKTFGMDPLRGNMGNCLKTDKNGNVYLLHSFRVAANFRKQIVRASLAGDNYCVAKFNPEGELSWASRLTAPKVRPRVSAFHVSEDGLTYVAANNKVWQLDANGKEAWKNDLVIPKGKGLLKLDMSGGKGEVFYAGLTSGKDYFVAQINRIKSQTIIWKGDKAIIDNDDFPALTTDNRASLYAAGNSKGKRFPGAQFDLVSKNRVFLQKYGVPDGNFQRDPYLLCKGESMVLLTNVEKGLRYQWYFNGNPVKGANNYYLEAKKLGTYQVQAVSDQCDKLSDPQLLIACDEDPMKNPVPKVVVTKKNNLPPPTPKDIPPTPPTPQIAKDYGTSISGKPKRLKGRPIKPQDKMEISSEQATIYLWDYGTYDQDTVSVNVNGEWLVEKLPLKKERIAIPYTFKPGNNYIILYALNLGKVPPNTASIMVDDGVRKQTLELRSNLKNSGMLRVRVK